MIERLPWFRCFPSRLLGALAGMQPDEGYTYAVVLLRIYETGGPVADTSRTLSRRTGLPERRVTTAVEALIASGKIQRLADGRLDSNTTHEEIAWQSDRRGDLSRAGKASALKRAKSTGTGSELDRGEKTQQKQRDGPTAVEHQLNDKEKEGERESSPIGLEEETSSLRSEVCPKRTRIRTQGGALFDEFWAAYPTDALMSKKAAADAFNRLSDQDKQKATDSLPAFKVYCSSHPDYRPVHACKYLTQRRFDGFEKLQRKVNGRVFVREGTLAFEAWQKRKKTPVTESKEHGGARGWYFPSEWPPALRAAHGG
jgi:hypothetical protein